VSPESVHEGQHLRTALVFTFVTVNVVPDVSGGFRLDVLCCKANVLDNVLFLSVSVETSSRGKPTPAGTSTDSCAAGGKRQDILKFF
jgi:hypothetical protein